MNLLFSKNKKSSDNSSQNIPMTAIIIENVQPKVEGGQHIARSIIGEAFRVKADIFKDGHEVIQAAIKYKQENASYWHETRMEQISYECEWEGMFYPETENISYIYTIEAWMDPLMTWQRDLKKKLTIHISSENTLMNDISRGVALFREMQSVINNRKEYDFADGIINKLRNILDSIEAQDYDNAGIELISILEDDNITRLIHSHPLKHQLTNYSQDLSVFINRKLAGFGAWYELFPRSYGTFRDCFERVDYLAEMGFDVLYFPPIHPIGETNRKGKNNSLQAKEGDPGSPWAIGGMLSDGRKGGHKDIHPELGTLNDFTDLVKYANHKGIEIALDFALQCSPDHPYVEYYPQWFHHEQDGSIKYAENPPKKYQDIYPLDFYCKDYQNLWDEMKSIVEYWIGKGVKIFRVDNPHTKPLKFWQWLISNINADHPDVIFLSEAFTKPKIMQYLCKAGFQQSYTHFTWLMDGASIKDYFEKLMTPPLRDYYIGNLFANTPDILSEYLQYGGENAFKARAVLASTLSSTYGIYSGYELCENTAVAPGSEEYMDSEKYQIKVRDWAQPGIKDFIKRINEVRRENPALQQYKNLKFLESTNSNLIAYYKATDNLHNIMIMIVNYDPHNAHDGEIKLPLEEMNISPEQEFQVEDLMTHDIYYWKGETNYVRIDPNERPAHIFRLKK